MKECGEELRKKLWGGHGWNPHYFVTTVFENTEVDKVIIVHFKTGKRKLQIIPL